MIQNSENVGMFQVFANRVTYVTGFMKLIQVAYLVFQESLIYLLCYAVATLNLHYN